MMGVAIATTDGIYDLIDSTEAANHCGVKVETIRTWVHRGLLTASGINERGRPLYRIIDVAKAERATRERARR